MFARLLEKIKNIPPSSCIYNLTGSSMALFLALRERAFIMVESTEDKARELCKDVLFFRSALRRMPDVFFLPEPDGSEAWGQRAKAIFGHKEGDSIITSRAAVSAKVWTQGGVRDSALLLKKHLEIKRDVFEQRLIDLGYKGVSLVVEHGEFSRRGWLFDVFPSTGDNPLRVEFFGDSIDTMREFDIGTQKSVKEVTEAVILPASEPSEGAYIFSVIGGADCFYSDSVHSPIDFPEGAVMLSRFSFPSEAGCKDAGLLPMAGYGIYHDERKSIYEFPDAIKGLAGRNRIIMVSSSGGQAERLKDILISGGIIAPLVGREDVEGYEGNVSITIGELSTGFFIEGLLILTEKEIFGGRPAIFRPTRRSKVSELLLSLDDLNLGDFIVHKDHGIGKFAGLVKQTVEGYEGDLMILEYSGGDRLYLPLYAIEKIQKYRAEEGIIPKIDRLGGKTWQRTKERIRKKIKEMAEKLLKLYAERQVSKGFSFSADTELHREFDNFFLYEETPDQIKAIEEIKSDMESEKPMDRLLCGDVGYGKTEVAMRAAFKAVYDGKQVAVLAPTTLLCEQHYRTFRQRFSAFPVNIDYLSRFKSKSEQKDAAKKIADGSVDIVIGTHALIRKDMAFCNLGLLVIDEEHRFGVAQKEKIKELKKGIDVLALTATPIPRTLNMALSGIRGMSLIETPPEERLAVRTIVSVFGDEIIKDAIEREMERKGQVFFVHNRIAGIGNIFDYVKRIVPGAKVSVAHGQMHERELEKIMQMFVAGDIDVLVSTAIIGSGLDIPNANTIIIDRADMAGLADLYQLRGRVGRSSARAYAYFLIPGKDIITGEAKKRLQAVQDMSYLGAGFRLAMKDLEIRGAGNMLGPEQSGHIHAVGFDMYIEMLEKAVSELKGIKVEEEVDPRISLRVSAFIPEEFIGDVILRLSVYRRIAAAKNDDGLVLLEAEMEDRFGSAPAEVQRLFDIMRIKMLAKKLLIADIAEADGNIRIIFSKDTRVVPENLFELGRTIGSRMRFLPEGFEIKGRNLSWDETYRLIVEILKRLDSEISGSNS